MAGRSPQKIKWIEDKNLAHSTVHFLSSKTFPTTRMESLTPEQQHRKDRILTIMDLEDWVYGVEDQVKPMRDGSLAAFPHLIVERAKLVLDWRRVVDRS